MLDRVCGRRLLSREDYAIDAVRRALPAARVGGPDTAGGGGEFLRGFLEHCLRGTNHATGRTGTPLDFVPFHANGAPKCVGGHVQMGIATHLRTIDDCLRDHRLVSGAEGQTDRRRRVRSRRLRRLLGAPARVPQRHDVLER